MIKRFDLDFIDRTLRTAGLVMLLCLVFGMYYYGFWNALSFFTGGIWGIVNLLLLKRFVKEAFNPDGIDTVAVILIALVKFPLLYISGYFLMTVEMFDIKLLVYGFSAVLGVMLLKALGRLFLGLDSRENNNTVQKVI